MSDSLADPIAPIPPAHLLPTEAERTRIRQLTKKTKSPILGVTNILDAVSLRLSAFDLSEVIPDVLSKEDKKWKERIVAAWAIGVAELPQENRNQAIGALRGLLGNRHHSKSVVWERASTTFQRTFSFTLFAGVLIACLVAFLHDPKWIFDPSLWSIAGKLFGVLGTLAVFVSVYSLPITFPMIVIRNNRRYNEARAMAAKSLLRQNAIEAMTELLEGAFEKSEAAKYECRIALRHFLPQITEANHNVMPLNSEEQIGRLLSSTSDAALWEAIIDYLEKFGQGSSARAVDNCLELLNVNLPDSVKYSELIAKCERVRIILYQRRTQNNARQELLRHSSIPTTQSDQLLRPAADSQTTPTEQLLRASNAEQ